MEIKVWHKQNLFTEKKRKLLCLNHTAAMCHLLLTQRMIVRFHFPGRQPKNMPDLTNEFAYFPQKSNPHNLLWKTFEKFEERRPP